LVFFGRLNSIRRLVISLAVLLGLLSGACTASEPVNQTGLPIETRAAIIDQLNPSRPDPDFVNQLTAIVQQSGMTVDYYSGEQVNLELYHNLPALNYHLIIFRAHSGLMGNGQRVDQKTCLFTNQPYQLDHDLGDQILNRVVKSAVDDEAPLFGIGAEFVNGSLRGRFDHTVIIMMGCASLVKEDLAEAFIRKGADCYFGFDDELGIQYSQAITLALTSSLIEDKLAYAEAAALTSRNLGCDPETGAGLQVYPKPAETAAISERLKPDCH